MQNLNFRELVGITKNLLKDEEILDRLIENYFSKQFKGDWIFVDSGTSAMQALINDFNLQGSEIILPSFICSDVFTRLFLNNNITPRIIDSEKGKLGISLDDVKKKITKKTKAIIIVHVLGTPNDPKRFKEFCAKNKIMLIEDCAHCLSLKYGDRYLGNYGDASIFSIAKEIPSFVGGIYVNNDRKIRDDVRRISEYNLSTGDMKKFAKRLPILYKLFLMKKRKETFKQEMSSVKIRSMPKIGKAILSYFMPRFQLENKRSVAVKFQTELRERGIRTLMSDEEIRISSAKSVPFFIDNRDEVIRALKREGIDVGVGWNPCFSLNPLARKKWRLDKTPLAEEYSHKMATISVDEIMDSKKFYKVLNILDKRSSN